jgi:hypothetical protein
VPPGRYGSTSPRPMGTTVLATDVVEPVSWLSLVVVPAVVVDPAAEAVADLVPAFDDMEGLEPALA